MSAGKEDKAAVIGVTTPKEKDFADWYTQTIVKAELVEYYDVSGCYIIRPWAFHIWETIQKFMDAEFTKADITNAYFPMFVTKGRLETEQDHVEGFSAEVAWVTKSGNSDLAEPVAIRPTSETIMYPAYQKWIRSHRDLPLKLNQWCPVVRWEFKQPTPFIRTREFLWQEGHTAHADKNEAVTFAKEMLEIYRRAYEEILAIPVVPGRKSITERFAGGDTTYSVEILIPTNGRGLQGATSHYLGTNFAKMFNIEYEDHQRNRQHVHQDSFGFSTRSLGALIMVHGDDQGLVLPPAVARYQVVIVPIVKKNCDFDKLYGACKEVKDELQKAGIRAFNDDRDIYNPGWKYNHWEMKGVPLRIEIGPRDLEKNTARACRRFDRKKEDVDRNSLVEYVRNSLDEVQKLMLEEARKKLDNQTARVEKFDEVLPQIREKKVILCAWCDEAECEEDVKKKTHVTEESGMIGGAVKTLCIPFEQPVMEQGKSCFNCGKPAKCYALWGRSY